MRVRGRTFPGGYRFKNFLGRPDDGVHTLGLPDRIILPLPQGSAGPLSLLVQAGDTVRAGQIAARDDDSVSSPLICSVNGTVEGVREVPGVRGPVQGVVIRPDGTTGWSPGWRSHTQQAARQGSDWRTLTPEALQEILYLSGVSALGSGGIPTRYRSSLILPQEVEQVILHGLEADVYNSSPLVSAEPPEERLEQLCQGIEILKRIMPRAGFHVAVTRHRRGLLDLISRLLKDGDGLQYYAVSSKYPQARDEVLIPTLLGVDYPYGCVPANLGVVVLDFQGLLQVYEAVVEGKPLVERLIGLSGPGFKRPLHLKVRIGTPVEAVIRDRLVREDGIRLMFNSPLSGPGITDPEVPVEADCSHLIALKSGGAEEFLPFARAGMRKDSYSRTFLANFLPFGKGGDTNIHGERRACLSCSFCADVCPVGILPNLLHRYVERDLLDETAVRYRIFNCIDCHLCTYVCPSKIPLSRLISQGKERLRAEGLAPGVSSTRDLKGLAQ